MGVQPYQCSTWIAASFDCWLKRMLTAAFIVIYCIFMYVAGFKLLGIQWASRPVTMFVWLLSPFTMPFVLITVLAVLFMVE